MAGSTDEDHSGIGYQKAEQLLEVDELSREAEVETEGQAEPETEPRAEPEAEDEQSTDSAGEQNPVFSGPDPDPVEQSPDLEEDVDEPEPEPDPGITCPSCGAGSELSAGDLEDGTALECSACESRLVWRAEA
jgi:hypothetical protein